MILLESQMGYKVHIYIYTYSIYRCIHIYMYIHPYKCIYIYIHVIDICIYIRINVYIYINMYIYTSDTYVHPKPSDTVYGTFHMSALDPQTLKPINR